MDTGPGGAYQWGRRSHAGLGRETAVPGRSGTMEDEPKIRVLFVDDEDAVLSTLRLIMRRMGPDWEVVVATSGAQALEIMASHPADILVSDMRMPGMSGLELLHEVMRRYPRTVRIILSGYATEEAVMQSAGATHQWLAKPFHPLQLQTLLQRVRGVKQRMGNQELQALVAKMSHLPSLPSMYLRISEALQSPRASLHSIGDLLAEDAPLSAKVLQLANSAAFGFQRSVASPAEAVQLLGVSCVRSMALAHHLFSSFQGGQRSHFPIQPIWDHSLRTAFAARRLADREGGGDQLLEQSFTGGLLHDIGKLVLAANLPAAYLEVWSRSQAPGANLPAAEREAFHATHADVGAYLLGIWGLPVPLVEAVAWHHEPGQSPEALFSPLTAVHVANVLSRGSEGAGHEEGGRLDQQYLGKLGLADRVAAWEALLAQDETPRRSR